MNFKVETTEQKMKKYFFGFFEFFIEKRLKIEEAEEVNVEEERIEEVWERESREL